MHTYSTVGNTRVPVAVSAPCPQCGNTQQASSYDANANKTKEIGHDGTVTFTQYDTKGRETERATFPSSYQAATTRPALAAATNVISTKWHATFNLPTQVAEPNKTTANTYSAKGMLTGTSWTATTDATGAAKFAATKTGSTYATGWSYSASSLATTIVTNETAAGAKKAVETGRWTYLYGSLGDPTRVTSVTAGNGLAYGSQYDAHGKLVSGVRLSGGSLAYGYDVRGRLTSVITENLRTDYRYDARGLLTRVIEPSGRTTDYSYNAAQQLTGTTMSGPDRIAEDTNERLFWIGWANVRLAAKDAVSKLEEAKARETERTTFPRSYQSATTRPALSAASKVISTQWHATFNLPTQVAEPNKTTANGYDAKGMLTVQSWTATTDATGAAKFGAVKSGSTYATTWSYSTSSLATTIVTNETAAGAKKAVETGGGPWCTRPMAI